MSVTKHRGFFWVPVVLILSSPISGFSQAPLGAERVEIDSKTMERVTTGVGKHVQAYRDNARGLVRALQPVFSAAGVKEGTELRVRLNGPGDVIVVESVPASAIEVPVYAELRLKMSSGEKISGFELKASRNHK